MTDLDNVLIVDFETRSKADLDTIGGRRYAEHPTTEVLCAVFHDPDEGWLEWIPPMYPPRAVAPSGRFITKPPQPYFPGRGRIPLRLAFDRCDIPVVAHNGIGFDRFIWSKLGWPEPPRWIDPAQLARRAGLPLASLDYLAKSLLGVEKDAEGNKATIKLSRVRPKDTKAGAKRGDYYTPTIPTETLERVLAYCRSDVEILASLWRILREWDDVEPRVLAVDTTINDRGILLDQDLARTLLAFDEWQGQRTIDAVAETMRPPPCGCTCVACADWPCSAYAECQEHRTPPRDWAKVVSAPVQLKKELHSLGVPVENAQRDTIEPLTKSPDPRVAALAKARLATTSITAGKLRAGLARVSLDSRLRDTLAIYGAHTWRWSGKGMQLHNLAKGKPLPLLARELKRRDPKHVSFDPKLRPLTWREKDAWVEEDIRRLLAGDVGDFGSEHIPTFLRACLTAPEGRVLVIADYSGVEARGLAWAAGDEYSLNGFRTPGFDPYRNFVVRLGMARDVGEIAKDDWRRQFGKIAELGLGYGMGGHRAKSRPNKKSKFEELVEDNGLNWADLRRDYGLTPGGVVDAWRELHWPVVDFWHDLQAAAVSAVNGHPCDVGPYSWARVGEDVWCMLPSGRPIVYHRMHTVRGDYGPELRYLGRKGVEYTYGGKLTENVIQATCRDFLAQALVEFEDYGLDPVLHVHDEGVAEVDEDQADDALHLVENVMSTVPGWGEGMPLGCEGFIAKRYAK